MLCLFVHEGNVFGISYQFKFCLLSVSINSYTLNNFLNINCLSSVIPYLPKGCVARRGKPAQILSDNGTYFVGCHNELEEFGKFLNSNESSIIESCAQHEIEWQFSLAHFLILGEFGKRG